MKFGTMYKYKVLDLTTGYYGNYGNLGYCNLPLLPCKEQIINEFYKFCSQNDKNFIDENYENIKTEVVCGKLPAVIYIYNNDKAIGCLEPQKD